TSAVATLTVVIPPSILSQPQSQTVKAGTNVSFSVSASGDEPFSYQWRFNGTHIPDATTDNLTLANVQPGDAGSYSVLITNLGGIALSSDAVLTVIAHQPVRIDAITITPDGCVHLQASGEPGNYGVEVTTDLVNWLELTNFASTNGT